MTDAAHKVTKAAHITTKMWLRGLSPRHRLMLARTGRKKEFLPTTPIWGKGRYSIPARGSVPRLTEIWVDGANPSSRAVSEGWNAASNAALAE